TLLVVQVMRSAEVLQLGIALGFRGQWLCWLWKLAFDWWFQVFSVSRFDTRLGRTAFHSGSDGFRRGGSFRQRRVRVFECRFLGLCQFLFGLSELARRYFGRSEGVLGRLRGS